MPDPKSRHASQPERTLTTASGQQVAWRLPRVLPQPEDLTLQGQILRGDGERLDHLAARALGDPEQSWRVLDANPCLLPEELEAEPGRALAVPAPFRSAP